MTARVAAYCRFLQNEIIVILASFETEPISISLPLDELLLPIHRMCKLLQYNTFWMMMMMMMIVVLFILVIIMYRWKHYSLWIMACRILPRFIRLYGRCFILIHYDGLVVSSRTNLADILLFSSSL